ncbi:MAG TPA: hypothetical protein VFI91_00145 [Longimicrobiaceae bacterium]|nr:hypothetical protein [Longimicrobiaceae bacterium]
MAEIDVAPKRKAQNTWIWQIIAIVAVIALMVWLAGRSADLTTAVPVETDSADVATTTPAGEAVELAAIAAAPDTFIGRTVAVSGVPVAATLGERAFWAEISGANPFLVVLAPEVANADVIAVGSTLDVSGSVAAVSDSLVTQWVDGGSIPESSRAEAAFATHYLLAEEISSQ